MNNKYNNDMPVVHGAVNNGQVSDFAVSRRLPRGVL